MADTKITAADVRASYEQAMEPSQAVKNVKETAQAFGEKALHSLGAFQRAGARQLSKLAGLPAKQTSEENFQQLANLVPTPNPATHPISSTLVSGLKAGAVAGAEVLGDPANLVLGPLAKSQKLKQLAIAAKESGALDNLVRIFGSGTVKTIGSAAPKLAEVQKTAKIDATALEAAVNQAKANQQMDVLATKLQQGTLVTDASSRNTTTAKRWQAIKDAQGVAPERVRGKVEMGNDQAMFQKFYEEAIQNKVSNPEAYARLKTKAHGGMRR